MLSALILSLVTGAGFPDCNGNGIDDAVDISSGASIDCDLDGVPDECQPCEDCDDSGLLDSCEALAAGGLTGQYYDSTGTSGNYFERILVRIDDAIDFNWGNGSPDPAVPTDDFSVRWTGAITAPVTGTYTFRTTTDDGVRLWIDDVLIIDRWLAQSPTEWSGTISLAAGQIYLLRMDYYEAGGGAEARLEWEAPGLPREVVPMSALSPLADTNGNGVPEACDTDCNGNGVPDPVDIADGTSTDCNGNCIPDDCDIVPPTSIAYWRFESVGPVIADSGPNALDGTGTNVAANASVPVDPVPQTGDANTTSLRLPNQAYVEVANPGLLTFAGASFTVEAWVQLNLISDTSGPDQRQFLLQKKVLASGGDAQDYSVLVQAGDISAGLDQNFGRTSNFTGRELVLTFGSGSQTWGVTSNLEITDNGWHAVSVSFDGFANEVRFGVDGTFETITFTPAGYNANAGPLLIGVHTNAAGNFNQFLRGSIDELRLTDGVLPVARLLASPFMADCNENGEPDECDIETGFSDDCDGNGVPDECDLDCNMNGTPDGCDIADGTSLDCQKDGIPDECQLGANDCDNDGVPDDCQLVTEDCNSNGILDACDIANRTSADCQSDGIPDDCQLTTEVLLSYDDGGPNVGFRADQGSRMAWLQAFEVSGVSVLDAIETIIVFYPAGATIDVYVWSDPNADSDPTDAQVLWSGQTAVELNSTMTIDVPDLDLGPNGTHFFVGFVAPVTSNDFPATFDTAGSARRTSWIVGSDAPIDPNDLAAGALEFAPIEESAFPGNWFIRARMIDFFGDCNRNGVPDACDVTDGTSADVDGNGTPDECEDCNANGTVDHLDIAGGSSQDCDGDGVPDECQIPFGDCNGDGILDDCQFATLGDCNGNGVLDVCDLAWGVSADENATGVPDECEDCNHNGILDDIDVALGTSEDCQLDGIPDECQLGDPPALPVGYVLDDGARETNIGVVAPALLVWLNHFTVEPGGEWIGAIEIVYGNAFGDQPITLYVWSDPDGNGAVDDAQVLTSVSTLTANVDTSTPTVEPILPVYAGPPGTSFFVGAIFFDTLNTAPIAADSSDPNGESIIFLLDINATIDPNDLTARGTNTVFPSDPWDVMVRARAFDGAVPFDTDGDGIPDECECPADLSGDGMVGFEDLVLLLSVWGPCPACPADLDGSGTVGFDDLLILLSAWGACS